jgi:alpha-beta hydrolase superfamily lysophospholipase
VPQNVAMTDGPQADPVVPTPVDAAPEPEPMQPTPEPEPTEPTTEPQPIEPTEPTEPTPEPAVVEVVSSREAIETAPTPEAIETAPTPEAIEAAPTTQAIEATTEPAAVESTPEPAVAEADAAPVAVAPVAVAPVAVPPAPAVDVPAPVAVAPASTAPLSHRRKRRRRWPWVVLIALLLGVLVVAAAALWYVSGLIGAGAKVDRGGEPFPLTVLSADGGNLSYSGPTGGWDDQGLIGVATIEGGYVQTEDPTTTGSGDTATTARVITKQVLPPPPAPGQAATLDGWYFPRNPLVGLGVKYEDVVYPSPAGPTPAWFIPGTSSTWVIFTHGRGATPLEGLRIANTVTELGYPMLLIKYRDDADAPVEDGQGNFGENEWPDLQAAVQYALDNGAQKIVLSGASMGGAITLSFLHNSPLANKVVGAFLDSPASDFSRIVRQGAADMGLPDAVTSAAMTVAAWRYGIDWAATDYTSVASQFTTPMLIVQGTADKSVPAVVNEEFVAAANPDQVTLELFEGAGHVMSWNVDRPRYETLLTDFLTSVAPPAG